jgi:gamma-glutamyltranspeptidase/glutathione hydrolase
MPFASAPTAAIVATALLLPTLAISAQPAPKGHAVVVSVQHNASDAGLEILHHGGNAVDAAVAVAFALAVTFPRAGNIGGGGFMLVRMARGEQRGHTRFLDFRERAPAAATANMYLDAAGNVVPGLSTSGYMAIGVPGTVAGLVYARQHYGKLTLAEDMAPAIRLATEGFALTETEAASLRSSSMAKFPESTRIFQRDGNFYATGEVFRQPDLAATLRRIAADPADFYQGKLAAQLAHSVSSHGGLLTAADLAAYKVADRAPLTGRFTAKGQTYDVLTAPPPSSGGIVLLETLNILAGYNLAKLGPDRSPAQIHILTEAFRRAYMDRADYLGDPDYNTMPLAQMATAKYAAAWRAGIDPIRPTPSSLLQRPAGFLPPPPAIVPTPGESHETTQLSVVDADGSAVSMTYTLNGLYGCGATAEGLGFLLNNEMDDFSSKPGTMNMFHLIQGPANAIGPGHRPLSSMTPTLVTTHGGLFRRSKVVLVLGSPGGSTIITTVANDLLSYLVNGLSLQADADAPRFHHQYLPDVLQFEKSFPHETVEAMRAMGYSVSQVDEADTKTPGVWGGSELIAIDPKTGEKKGANDARYPAGKVASY